MANQLHNETNRADDVCPTRFVCVVGADALYRMSAQIKLSS